MTATYEAIATTTLGSAQANITFSSISGSFTDLVLVVTPKMASGTGNLLLQFNSDTGNNYSWTILGGAAGSALSTRVSNVSGITATWYGYIEDDNHQNTICHIQNYSNTTTNKTVLCRSNQVDNGVGATVGLWRSTSAINAIKIYTDSVNLATGTTATLYGIKAE